MLRPADPLTMPGSLETPEESLAGALSLSGTPGQVYVERRGIPVQIAQDAGVRYAADFEGRPAVVVPLYDDKEALVSLHGRYPSVAGRQDKMFTIGCGGGTINVLGGWHTDPFIVVEGLFDALSLSTCGYACAATIGRWVPWLGKVSVGRRVWLAFDAGRRGDSEAARYAAQLQRSEVIRMRPPGLQKDWNTALVKRGVSTVARWVQDCLASAR